MILASFRIALMGYPRSPIFSTGAQEITVKSLISTSLINDSRNSTGQKNSDKKDRCPQNTQVNANSRGRTEQWPMQTILARAQLGEIPLDRDRDALRKEYQS